MATDETEDWKLKSSDECKAELGFKQVNGVVYERDLSECDTMEYQYTDAAGAAYYECECGVTYNEAQFTNGRCPECQ